MQSRSIDTEVEVDPYEEIVGDIINYSTPITNRSASPNRYEEDRSTVAIFQGPSNSPDLNPIDYSMWELLQEKVCKIHITHLDELKQQLRTEWAKLDHIVIAAAIRNWRRLQSRSVIRVFYIFSCNIFHMLLSSGFKSGEFETTVALG